LCDLKHILALTAKICLQSDMVLRYQVDLQTGNYSSTAF
jgi:hypothetical protein